ncbi:MAG: hypothetical protein V1748_07045 [Actinomycetota bacterium]
MPGECVPRSGINRQADTIRRPRRGVPSEGTTRPGFETWLCVGNPSDTGEAQVSITSMRGDGTTAAQDIAVPPNSRKTVSANEVTSECNTSNCERSLSASYSLSDQGLKPKKLIPGIFLSRLFFRALTVI